LSVNPFTADPAIRDRVAALDAHFGPAARSAVSAVLDRTRRDLARNLGGVLPAVDAQEICRIHGLTAEELMHLARPLAEPLSDPSLSDFHVAAVGLEDTGGLLFGGNLEFPGTSIWNTVHGEGFLATRAYSRGTRLTAIALGEAHPCAHCRQYLSEFAGGPGLMLIDRIGHRLPLGALYPWPFDPAYLGDAGAVASEARWSNLRLPVSEFDAMLTAAVRRAHAPYSKSPAAVALRLNDGNHVAGVSIESVAFNPTMSPLQSALIDLRAHGYRPADVAAAAIGVTSDGPVDYAAQTRDLLAAVAPGVTLNVFEWRS
jgi:cytidine deaminase